MAPDLDLVGNAPDANSSPEECLAHVSCSQNGGCMESGAHPRAIPSAVRSFSMGLSSRNGNTSSGSSNSSLSASFEPRMEFSCVRLFKIMTLIQYTLIVLKYYDYNTPLSIF